MPKISFTWKFFSSYYISTLIVFFLIQVKIIANIITSISYWLINFISVSGYKDAISDNKVWLILWACVVIFTFLLQTYVIQPLGFYIDKEDRLGGWDRIAGFVLLFGTQIFLINKVFDQPMPPNFVPIPPAWNVNLIRLLGGFENTFANSKETEADKFLWQVRDIFWNIGPIAFMYIKTILIKPPKKAEPKAEG
jgi:hypothetical protein